MGKIEEQRNSFIEMYLPVKRQISNYCRALTRDEYLAGDLLQDTLLSAYEGIESIRKKESFLYYLCATAKRIFLKQKRKNKKIEGSIALDVNEPIGSYQEGESNIDIQILYKAIDQLPVKQREAIVMFEIVGLSLKEIKMMQGGSMSGVKSRIVRAREKLADMLTDLESERKKTGNQKKVEI